MKLLEALNIIQTSATSNAEPFRTALVCGFTPLDVQTFLHAELQAAMPGRRVEIEVGHFGDVAGTLRNLHAESLNAIALVLEWSDLDARLGTRQLGGWGPAHLNDIVEHAGNWLAHIEQVLDSFSCPIAVTLPALPLPPLFHMAGWQLSRHEAALRSAVSSFAESVSRNPRVRLINAQRLDERSPMATRFDMKSEWTTGFPYSSAHAGTVAALLSSAIVNAPPKKGLITDLDNTLWRGIVGDAGVKNVWWDLDHSAQHHGVYQQMLSTLAQEGVLVAIASKNDPPVVQETFERHDILIPKDRIFPLDVSWGSKAHAVSRILTAWNIAANAVVFVDDNPAELAEVEAAHPGIEAILFPDGSPKRVYELCVRLRDIFGKPNISAEDEIRLESLRAGAAIKATADNSEGFSEALLEHADADLTLSFRKDPQDTRTFELINKTNQFNLNGKRIGEAEWGAWLNRDDTFVVAATYKDRFGALGKIAVLSGCRKGTHTCVHHWVMSCRAFARRIEYQCVRALFEHLGTDSIVFDYVPTDRNGPLTKLLTEFGAGKPPEANFSLQRDAFLAACPKLFHQVHTEG